jgi:hypothetical protein
VGIENVVEEEEYNQFDEIPSFGTSYKPQLFGTNKTPYLQSDHSEKNLYTEIKEEKASLISAESFCNIKDAMYWWNFNRFVIYGMWWNLNPACNIFCQRYYIYSVYILLQFSNGQEMRTNEPASPLLQARDED